MRFLRLITLSAVLCAVWVGCVSIGPQEVELTALRQALLRLNRQPEILNALPDTWLDDSGATNFGCHRSELSKIFDRTYRQETDGRLAWSVRTSVRIWCSEEDASHEFQLVCRNQKGVEIVTDEFGAACVSRIVQLRNHGLLPSTTFYSHVSVQSGSLVVEFNEGYRWKLGAAKQVAIDDVTARLRRVLEEYRQRSYPSAP